MTLDEYQALARRTSGAGGDANCSKLTCALGLAGEAGEIADLLKKHVGHGHPLDLEKLGKEIGDLCWYIAEACSLMGLRLSVLVSPVEERAAMDIEARVYQEQNRHPQSLTPAVFALRVAEAAGQAGYWVHKGVGTSPTLIISLDGTLRRVTQLVNALGLDLDTILAANIAKLAARYPAGFSSEASINRVEG